MSNSDLGALIDSMGQAARNAGCVLTGISDNDINALLDTIATGLLKNKNNILTENQKDIAKAQKKGLSPAMIDRLVLNESRINSMAEGVRGVAALPDPVGKILWETVRPNGLMIKRIAVPIGVLGMIYESRPNVTVDAAALCLKSRNAVVLRGGSESLNSSMALHAVIKSALKERNLPAAAVSMIPVPDREAVGAMLKSEYIDVMIPRGGRGLIERVMAEATMPVFGHLEGICHTYIHHAADPTIAREVTFNAKMRRTGVCGATETLLIDKNLAPTIAKDVLTKLINAGCIIVGDEAAQTLDPRIGAASAEDWVTEYLDAKLSVAIVENVESAVNHINTYGSHHTDSILTNDTDAADYFLKYVDSGIVLHNTSTQFADGGEFGMGAEIGIATGKLHARGPVGVEQLCTYKYVVMGDGQIRG
jgi:glutamate-5-semialdehyde dehydrogenase